MDNIKAFIMKVVKIFLPDAVPAKEGEPVFTHKGLVNKLCFYGAFYVISIMIFFIPAIIKRLTNVSVQFDLAEHSIESLDMAQIVMLTICVFIEELMPFLRFLTKLIPVTGAIFVFANGYFFTYTSLLSTNTTGVLYRIVCLIVSFIIATLPYFVFRYMHVRLPKKTSKIVYIAFFVSIFASSILKLLSYAGNPLGILDTVAVIQSNSVVIILISVFKILIPFMFLLLAYETCAKYIALKVPKKMEWAAFFAIIYTTFRLYETIQRIIVYKLI